MQKLLLALGIFAPLAATAADLPESLNTIYSYQCHVRFVEGEGAGEQGISCYAHQNLGQLRASYTHYLYAGESRDNFSRRHGDINYATGICGKQMMRAECSRGEPEPRFGLSAHAEGIYRLPILLDAGPRDSFRAGFAAAMTANGTCPLGLVPVYSYVARPFTVMEPLPTNFINRDGNLDSWQLREEILPGDQNATFDVYRRASARPCDFRGDCRGATFGEAHVIQSVPYIQQGQGVCVVPKESLPLPPEDGHEGERAKVSAKTKLL